jgi:hypothetical protein
VISQMAAVYHPCGSCANIGELCVNPVLLCLYKTTLKRQCEMRGSTTCLPASAELPPPLKLAVGFCLLSGFVAWKNEFRPTKAV